MARANRRAAGERTARRPAPDEIARKAFDIYVTRGGEHGHDLEDWLKAESELLAELVSRRRPRAD
jgi:hypothetical protein